MARISFDIDDTLWKLVEDKDPRPAGVGAMCACGVPVKQELDEDMCQLVEDLFEAGNEVNLWSAGGVEYAKNWVKRFKPQWEGLIGVLPKAGGHNVDICFDDQEVDLATILLRIKREHADHWKDKN